MTRFGVTIPACNEQDYIADTLKTLIEQDVAGPGSVRSPAHEIVVVESNSTDHTADVVDKIARQSPVKVTLVRAGNASMTAARVTGITYLLDQPSPPQYLVSADADTRYPPGWLTALAYQLDHGADLVTCAGYMDPYLWWRCPALTQRYLDEIGTIFFDPQTRAHMGEATGPFSEQVYTDFGRPMCEAGFAITPHVYRALGGFQTDAFDPGAGQRLLHERFPLIFGAALAGYLVTQIHEPWWSTSPRRLVSEPDVQFGPEFAQTEFRQYRGVSDHAYAALEGNASTINLAELRFNCVLDYIILPCVTQPQLVRRNRGYFGDDWQALISAIYAWLADHPGPDPGDLVDFAAVLTRRYADRLIERVAVSRGVTAGGR